MSRIVSITCRRIWPSVATRDLAGALSRGTCNECHSPENPQRTKRLVLMQTPVHAAGEIKRIMRTVREDKMPLGETEL